MMRNNAIDVHTGHVHTGLKTRANSKKRKTAKAACILASAIFYVIAASSLANGPPFFTEWETFTVDDGLPSDKIFALVATHEAVWIGTDEGLVRYADGKFQTWDDEDGLVYPVISGLAWDEETGDLWISTFGGVSRFSGGRFENFNQLTSGLANDVVYGVAVEGRYVWTPTAAGASRFDTWTSSWEIFNNKNAPMHEIWCYGVAAGEDRVYLAVWGGGVLQFDRARGRWREFRDPDGEMELDLMKDDGPVSDVVASVAYADGILWAGTYFGVNRYDGRRWSGYSTDDSGLASDFVNFVVAEGPTAWFATDSGLSHFDGTTWTTYRRREPASEGDGDAGSITIYRDGKIKTLDTRTALAHNFVSAVARRQDELWAGTEKGLSRGTSGTQ